MRYLLFSWLLAVLSAGAVPRVTLTKDDTEIRESCDIVIPPGTIIADLNTNGVLHIAADGLTVRFVDESELVGARPGTPWDALVGIGIRIDGHRGVALVGARVHGFFNGLVATDADALVVEDGDFSDNHRQHLRSTPAAEDGSDWLFPHHNDEQRWRDEYGGAVCIEKSRHVTVRNIRVRRGQNGIVLDRVEDSRIYDNDCSFLSGWGLALWRCNRNVISRNALDFCVRGHSEGVYNRGQDSAGILCFEQSSDNVFAENSVTHGGDGFFGFAGREALGEFWMEKERDRLRRETGTTEVDDRIRVPEDVARDYSGRGCNRNILIGNDFSYAAAHGIEMTFSEENVFARNRIVENAICGIWGGYSSGTRILHNEISRNGGMAYGLERGAVNMEHASSNWMEGNDFTDNKCAIHLWWDEDGALLKMPGVAGNDDGVSSNVIVRNTFTVTANPPFHPSSPDDRLIVLQLRDDGKGHVRDNTYAQNEVHLNAGNGVEFAVTPGSAPLTRDPGPGPEVPKVEILGRHLPVGARRALQGRDQIVMDEWGPWDHEQPLVRPAAGAAGESAFEVFGVRTQPALDVKAGAVVPVVAPLGRDAWRVTLQGPPGVASYRIELSAPGLKKELTGTLIRAEWNVVFFPWTIDPRKDLEGWRRLASSPAAVRLTTHSLDFPYGGGGPRDLNLSDRLRREGPGADHFGMIARTRLRLPAGAWKFRVLSDDGVRVRVNGKPVVENWTWHGPTSDEGRYAQATDSEVEILVEHFEIDGYAVLQFELQRD